MTPELRHTTRDLRIDLVRGTALIVIFLDHVEAVTHQRLFSRYSPHAWGLSDALEVFVFVSGYVFGLAYSRVLKTHGLVGCQGKAVRRCFQLYFANTLVLVAVSGLTLLLHDPWAESRLRIQALRSQPLPAAIGISLALYQPFGFDILPLYIVILLIMPTLLWLSQRNVTAAFGISLALYLLSQWPQFNLRTFPENAPWYFNPFAWQLLFFLGTQVSTSCRPVLSALARNVWLSGFAFVILLALTLAWNHVSRVAHLHSHVIASNHSAGLLRLAHFALFSFVGASLLQRNEWLCHTPIGIALVRCGQCPLAVFSLGLFQTYVAVFAFSRNGSGLLDILLYEITACVITVLLASWLVTVKASHAHLGISREGP